MTSGFCRIVVMLTVLGQLLLSGPAGAQVNGPSAVAAATVPSVVGQSVKDAMLAVEKADLTPKFQLGKRAARPDQAHKVYATNPAPGTRLAKGSVVQLTLYAGAPGNNATTGNANEQRVGSTTRGVVAVPSIIGSSVKNAKAVIEAIGLKPTFVLGSDPPSPSASLTVYAQEPQSGATIASGQSVSITIYSRVGVAGGALNLVKSRQPELSEVQALPFLNQSDEVIDPRSGRLFLTTTDLIVPAGAIELEVRRSLQLPTASPGLLGANWRLNWESRLIQSADQAIIESEGRQLVFTWNESSQRFTSSSSDYLLRNADGRVVWVRTKDRVRDTFDPEGRFIERDARNGNKVSLSYDANGRLARIAGPHGTWLELRSDESGRLVEIKSSTGQSVHYGFMSGGKAQEASRDADSLAIRYAYNQNGALQSIEHPQFGVTSFAYDAKGRVMRRTWADGSGEQYDYNDAERTLRYTDPSGQVTTTVFSADRRFAEITSPLGHKSVIEYDQAGRTVALTGPTKQTTRFTFDNLGRTTSVENPLTGTTHLEYFGNTELVSAMNGPGEHRQVMEYDAQGNLVRLTNFPDQTKNVAYDRAADGQITSITTGTGQKQEFTYDSAGRRESAADAAGNKWRYEYDAQGNLAHVIDPLGTVSEQTFETQGRLTSTTNPDGATTRYAYEQRGRLFQITTTDERGGETRAVYDQRGRLMSVTDAAKRTTRYSYDASGRLVSVTDPAGKSYRYEYDALGNLTSEINPLGGVVQHTYDALGKVTSDEGPTGAATRFEYSPAGVLTKLVDPASQTTTYAYDDIGQLIDMTSSMDQTTQYEYAAAGRVSRMIPPSGPIVSYDYDNFGNLAAVRQGEKIVATYEFDTLGRRVKEKQASGWETTYRYDAVGNLVGWQDNEGGHETIKYDAVGRTVAITDATGATTSYHYDPAGNVLGTTDPLGKLKRRTYNFTGELVEVAEPNGDKAKYEYDAAGRLAAVQHPGGGKGSFEYDGLGNALRIVGPLGHEVRSTYDPAGRVLTTTDAKGQTTTFEYDKAGRLSAKRLASGNVVQYQYDQRGNTTAVDDGEFPVRYAYDDAGNLIRIEYPAIKRSLAYEYNPAGLNTKFIDSEGRSVLYEYDDYDRLTTIKFENEQSIIFAYDPKDRVTSVAYPNGVHGKWKYDANNWVTELTYQDASKKTIAGWAYTYDAAGNCVQIEKHNGQAFRYAYDPSGQLVEENSGDGESVKYSYGAGGNRATSQYKGEAAKYQYDEGDRLLSVGNETFAYDANGNLIERKTPQGVTRYEYDDEDQLVKVVLPDKSEVSYGYAPTGDRIWRRDAKGMTWFVTGGVDLVAELDENLKPQATYLHGPGIDQPLMMARGGQQYYFHADRLGSIHSLTDPRGGLAVSYDYDAFGQVKSKQSSLANPFTYTARELDATTGLYYYRARYYDASTGRFLSVDPVPFSVDDCASLNPYIYVCNKPLFYTDPLGAAPRVNMLNNRSPYAPQSLPAGLDPNTRLNHFTDKDTASGIVDAARKGQGTSFGPSGGTLHVTTLAPGSGARHPAGIGTPKSAGASFSATAGELAQKGMKIEPNLNKNYAPGTNWLITRQPGQSVIKLPVTTRMGGSYFQKAANLFKPAAKWLGEKTVKMVPFVGAGMAMTDIAQAAPQDRPHEIAKAVGGELPGPLGIPGEAIAGWIVPPGTTGPTDWIDLPPEPGSPADQDSQNAGDWVDLPPEPGSPNDSVAGSIDLPPAPGSPDDTVDGWIDLPPEPGTPAAADVAGSSSVLGPAPAPDPNAQWPICPKCGKRHDPNE